MANLYDEPGNQQTLPDDKELRKITDIGVGREDQVEAEARDDGLGASAIEDNEQKTGRNADLSSGFDNATRDEISALPDLKAIRSSPGSRRYRAKQVFFGSTGRKIATGFGITGVVGGSIFSLFFMLLPALKLPALLDVAERAFSGNVNIIGDTVAQRMISQYISQKVIPGMVIEGCETTNLNKSCARPSEDSSYVGKLYNAWKDSRFENKLFENHGFEIRREGGQIFIRSDKLDEDIFKGDYTPDNQAEFDKKIFTALYDNPKKRDEIRKVVNDAVEGETKWKTWLIRQQVASLVSRKYGIPRCNVACGGRDKARDFFENNAVVDRSRAIRGFALQKIFGPRSEGTGLAIECAIDSFSCLEATTEDNGVKRTKYQTDLRTRAAEFAASHSAEEFEKLLKDSESIRKNGLGNHMVSQLFGKTGELGAKIGAKLIPGVGWADTIISLIAGGSRIGLYYSTIYYSLHATDAIGTLTMFSVAQDEYDAGDMDNVTYGSFVEAVDADPNTINDGMGAESSRAYKAFADTPAASLASLTGVAYAAESEQCETKDITTEVTDTEGNTVDYGPSNITTENETLMCANESLIAPDGMLADVTSGISDVFNFVPGLSTVAVAIVQWQNALVGWVFDATGLQGAIDFIGETVGKAIPDELMEAMTAPLAKVFSQLFPPLVEAASSGSRWATALIHGNALIFSDAAIENGGKAVTGEEYAQLEMAYQQQGQEQFEQQTVFARMFDSDNSRSLISQVAMALPVGRNVTELAQPTSVANALSSTFASIFSGRTSAAPASTYATYFTESGIRPHTYPMNDPVLSANYEEYEATNQCSGQAINEQRAASAILDENTGQYYYPSTSGCLLIKNMTCTMAIQVAEKFSSCAQSETQTSDTGGSAAGGTFGTSTDMKALAQQVLDNRNITLGSAFDNPLGQIRNVANGTETARCHVSPYVLNLLLFIGESHRISVSSLNRYCANMLTGSGESSYHWRDGGGHAVDINWVDNVHSTGGTLADLALLREVVPKLPSGSQVGQSNCRTGDSIGPLPPGVTQIFDSCNHIHITMPVYDY